jgi:hypothetical protein
MNCLVPLVMTVSFENWSASAVENQPPPGDGYQLWENTSEGSPISPVFKTKEELATWCESSATIWGSNKISKEEWLTKFDGWITYEMRIGNKTVICI